MTCPKCQKELPENFEGGWCPFCEGWFFGKQAPVAPASAPTRFNWLLFLCALLLPPLLTLVTAATARFTMSHPVNESVSAAVGLIGGCIGGLIGGVMLACVVARSIPGRIFLSVLLSAILIVVCVTLCLVGCNAGGYQFRLGE